MKNDLPRLNYGIGLYPGYVGKVAFCIARNRTEGREKAGRFRPPGFFLHLVLAYLAGLLAPRGFSA